MTSTHASDSNTSSSSESSIVREASSFTAEEDHARDTGQKSNETSAAINDATNLSNDTSTSQQD